MAIKSFGLVAALVACAATPVAAQSFDGRSWSQASDARLQAGIVIPFGSSGTEAERAPRIEAWSDRHAPRRLQGSDLERSHPRPLRIGVSLGQEPRLLVSGREMPGRPGAKGVSTLGWVGIGTAVVLVVGGVLLVDAFKDMNN